MTLLEVAHDTMWVRDYGPVFVVDSDRRRGIVDLDYRAEDRPNDDRVPGAVSPAFQAPLLPMNVELEGGNLLSNGDGLVLSTTAVIRPRDGEGSQGLSIREWCRHRLGARQLVLLEPLAGEPTGHVDMFAMFVSKDTVVVGSCDPKQDAANATILDDNARRLGTVRVPGGLLRVLRIPMPRADEDVWRTYTNGILLNGALLAPSYRGVRPEIQKKAYRVLRRALPGWQIVAVDASDLIRLGGAFHCISVQVPAGAPASVQPRAPSLNASQQRGMH
jgi:agmatine/peptidylarginine deiminase